MIKHSDEHGYTMLETILYISLLMILAGTIAKFIGNTFMKYKNGRINQQIIDLRKAIIQYTAASENYANLTKEEMAGINGNGTPINGKINNFPMDMKIGYHALNGKIKIGSSRIVRETGTMGAEETTTYDYMFFITFVSLPYKSCIEILTQGQFYGDGSDLDTLIVNGPNVPVESGDDNSAISGNSCYAWQYPYSMFNLNGIVDNDKIKVMYLVTPDTPNVYSRPTISDAMDACQDNNHNRITWIFS